MKKYLIPNPDDYPEYLSVPWPEEQHEDFHCYGYAMNSARFPSHNPGYRGYNNSLEGLFNRNTPSQWLSLIRGAEIPFKVSQESQKYYHRHFLRAVRDGSIPVVKPISCKGFRLIGMNFVFHDEVLELDDYHWLRFDKNGLITNKPGSKKPELLTNKQGKQILYPCDSFRHAALGKQMFASYFLTPAKEEDLGKLPFDQDPVELEVLM